MSALEVQVECLLHATLEFIRRPTLPNVSADVGLDGLDSRKVTAFLDSPFLFLFLFFLHVVC